MKLYTKTGDDGTTSLFGGKRVSKDDIRVQAYGDVDELNAIIGVTLAESGDAPTAEKLRLVQSDLFVMGAELATPGGGKIVIQPKDVTRLESWIDEATADVPELTCFILPGGALMAARLQHARAVCRRAERSVVTVDTAEGLSSDLIQYLNRLSDLLFAWARLVNHRAGVGDVPWTTPST